MTLRQAVYVVCAVGDEALAEQLAAPLREAGYEVAHNGTIAVGESLIGEAEKAITSGSPIVLCGTARAIGSAWAHKIVNAAHGSVPPRVYVVQMERQAYVDQLALDGKIARYCDDPARASRELIEALAKHFPPVLHAPVRESGKSPVLEREFLDQITSLDTFDFEALTQFRMQLRDDYATRYPPDLTPWEFLDETNLRVEGRLTRAGALLFVQNPISACPSAIVKCTLYGDIDNTGIRDTKTMTGTVTAQVFSARQFVADRVVIGEAPSADQAQSETVYQYPMIAVREVIANALVHRDYSISDSCVHVRLFMDRLEVSSPGPWIGRDLRESLEYDLSSLKSQSRKRNFQLAYMLSGIKLVEGEGSGIPTALRACVRTQSPAPTVIQEDGFVTVILRRRELVRTSYQATNRPVVSGDGPAKSDQRSPVFRDRQDELHKVLHGITSAAGPHFWLVVAPPQLGKTWFLERLSADSSLSEPVTWLVKKVDLRAQPRELCGDAATILTLLFGRELPATIDQGTFRGLAREITKSGQPYLCLLDSAELLTEETAHILRECFSQIYQLVQEAGADTVRLALIVASRRDSEWRGITPSPRLAALPLVEFHAEVIQEALHDLASEMGRSFPSSALLENAARVHRLTEGLPALLIRCLQWIRTNEWIAIDQRLEDPRRFAEIAASYIQHELLTPGSLLPASEGESEEKLRALVHAYRVLVPYRLFTQSHLRHHLESDAEFRDSMLAAGWAVQDLWRAIGETALLRRPLNEPWQEIHAAIRRLLYRYFYETDAERERVNNEARKFAELWADGQVGTEQVIGFVECLWHEARALGVRKPAEMEQRLAESARKLSGSLRESAAFTLPELRLFIVERMMNDEELQEAVSSVDGLFGRLVAIVSRPEARHE